MPPKKKSRESWGIIDPLPSGRFRARYTHLEHRFSAPHTFALISDAREWLAGTRSDITRGTWKDPRKVSSTIFGPYAKRWVEQRATSKGKPLAPKTRVEYERQLDKSLARFADDDLAAITPERVRAWHSERVKKAATAAAREARLLRAIFNTAIEDEIIEKNPVAAKFCRSSAGKSYRPPTLEELGLLLENMPERLRAAVVIAAYGSARLSEWRALRPGDVTVPAEDDGQVCIKITRQAQQVRTVGWVVGDTKSEEGKREVVLPSALTPLIRDHLERFADALLFPPQNPKYDYLPDHEFRTPWDKARKAVGVKGEVREHDLRAFAGTMHAQAGATLRETMAFLGHSTTVAAMAYQATTGRDAELADRMPVPKSLT